MAAGSVVVWTVGDLRRATLPPKAFQHCRVCGNDYSANPGDYFMAADDAVLACCGEPVAIVTRTVQLAEVTR